MMSPARDAAQEAFQLNQQGMEAYRDGDFQTALEKLQAAHDLLDPSSVGDAFDRSTVLNNLGLVASERGDPDQAFTFFTDSLRAADLVGGLSGTSLAVTLDNIAAQEIAMARRAGPYWLSDEYLNAPTAQYIDRAADHLKRAQAIFKQQLPASRDDLMISLGHSIEIKRIAGDVEGALEVSTERCHLMDGRPVDPGTTWDTMSVHADLLVENGKVHAAAESLRSLLGADMTDPHPSEARGRGLTRAARIFALDGDIDGLEYSARRAVEIDDVLIGVWLSGASEAAARHQFRAAQTRTEQILGAVIHGSREGSLPAWACEMVLSRKGLLAYRLERAWAHARASRTLAPQLGQVMELRKQVVALDLGDHHERTIGDARARQQELARQRDAAEAALFAAVDAELGPVPAPSLADLRASLPPETVFVDLLLAESPEPDCQRFYVAVLFGPGAQPRYVTLGRMNEIDEGLLALVDELARPPASPDVARRGVQAGEVDPIDQQIRTLSAWSSAGPLPRNLMVSTVGVWARLPLCLLLDNNGQPLIQEHVVHTVPSVRWWVDHQFDRKSDTPANGKPYVAGDPDFDADLADRLDDLGYFLRLRISRLKHSAAEAEKIAARLGCDAVTGREATRANLLQVNRPKMMHLATHGDFISAIGSFDEQREPTASITESVGGVVITRRLDLSAQEEAPTEPRERHRQRARWLTTVGPADQLSRSVLLLAGFNAWVAGVDRSPGLVSAAELALLDLRGTEMVVLSACRSGVGSVDYSDGSVIGIRTACLIAGADSCVSSLWEVLDQATVRFMDDFYAGVIDGVGRADALRACQMRLRDEHPDPYYWATWTLEGAPEPLSGSTP